MNKKPKVSVLLATYNGRKWIETQISSILGQKGVDVQLIVSDDNSTDGTFEYIRNIAQNDSRIYILPKRERFGSAAKNFYRLILDVELNNADYFALADQDDDWLLDKLINQIEILNKERADGVSSNVVAFWPDGKHVFINKSQPLRKFDFLFESAGPGCTFLMSPWLIQEVRSALSLKPQSNIECHDWFIYTLCRVSGGKWHISSVPTLKYRQHANNVLGANIGRKARGFRLRQIINGWYRQQVYKTAELALGVSSDPDVQNACKVLMDQSFLSRFRVLTLLPEARRKVTDRCMLLGIVLCFWSSKFNKI